ncbi:MAG TPA: hypothetical protein VK960_07345 [Acidimicrobiia bacterium]|nr:hypothetical protein [Acidimicrobiia bacterium]
MPPTDRLVGTAIYSLVFNLGISYSSLLLDDIEHALVSGGIVVGTMLIGSTTYARCGLEHHEAERVAHQHVLPGTRRTGGDLRPGPGRPGRSAVDYQGSGPTVTTRSTMR